MTEQLPEQLVERLCAFNCDAESSCSCAAHQLYRAGSAQLAATRAAPQGDDPCFDRVMEAITNAQRQQQAQLAATHAATQWRCFHCDEVFTDEAEAREHFGASMDAQVACRLSRDDVKQLRALEALNVKLQRECENLENDSRLWHEAEADRERWIGRRQWWQELDYREGEKIVLTEKLAATHAAIRALRDGWRADAELEYKAAKRHPARSKFRSNLFNAADAKVVCANELEKALARLFGDPEQGPRSVAESGEGIGGGARPNFEDNSMRSWVCGCYEDQHGYHYCSTHGG